MASPGVPLPHWVEIGSHGASVPVNGAAGYVCVAFCEAICYPAMHIWPAPDNLWLLPCLPGHGAFVLCERNWA